MQRGLTKEQRTELFNFQNQAKELKKQMRDLENSDPIDLINLWYEVLEGANTRVDKATDKKQREAEEERRKIISDYADDILKFLHKKHPGFMRHLGSQPPPEPDTYMDTGTQLKQRMSQANPFMITMAYHTGIQQ